MSQKEIERESSSSTVSQSKKVAGQVSDDMLSTSSRTSNKGLLGRLSSAISKHASIKDIGFAAGVTFLLAFIAVTVIPTVIVPLLAAVGLSGLLFGALDSDDESVFSVMVGTGIAGLIAALLFVSLPFGLTIPLALVFGVVSGGLGTAAHQMA